MSRERSPEHPSLDHRFRTYRNLNVCEFDWYSPGLPPPLADLLKRPDVPLGAALDLGCGSGAITMSLGHRFRPVVGIDVVEATVTGAKAYRVPRNQRRPLFLVGAVSDMPFRGSSFSFVFDRGCLNAVPVHLWRSFLEEVGRVLRPGGMLQLFAGRPGPRWWSARTTGGFRRGRGCAAEWIRSAAPPSLELLEVRQVGWSERASRRHQTHALFRKRG